MDIVLGIVYLVLRYVWDTLYIIFVVHRMTWPISVFGTVIFYGTLYYFLGMYLVYFVIAWYVVSCFIYVLSSTYRDYHRSTVQIYREMRDMS